MGALALPQAQGAEVLSAVADHGHVVGHGAHGEALHGNLHSEFVAADAPGIAVGRPIVRQLSLAAVHEALLEQAVLVAQTVAVQGDVVGGGAVQEAGGQAAQTAVAQRCVLHVLQVGKLHAALGKARLHILQYAQGEQVVVDQPAHQILGGQVQRPALFRARGMIVAPHGRDGIHHSGGDTLVQLHRAGLFKIDVEFALDDGLGGFNDLLRVQWLQLAAVIAAVQNADFAGDCGVIRTLHAPQPVAAYGAGEVHAGLAAQAQKVLHGRDGGFAHTAPGSFQHGAHDVVIRFGHAQLFAGEGAHLLGGIPPPAEGGVVVVSAGVDDVVGRMVFRQILIAVIGIEGELHHLHARIAGLRQQFLHTLAHNAQILGHDAQIRQLLPDAAEQPDARAQLIFAVAGGLFGGGNGVVIREADEVVDAQYIKHLAQSLQAGDPPAVAGFLMLLPVVEGIAPALAVLLEVIRRHARDADGAHVLVQLKHVRVEPDVAGILRHVDGHIAHQLHALFPCVGVQALPLAEEHVLAEDVVIHGGGKRLGVLLQRLALAVADILIRPGHPGGKTEVLLDGVKQRVIPHPGMPRLEGGQLRSDFLVAIGVGLLEQRALLLLHGFKIHLFHNGKRNVHVRRQKAVLHHQVKINHQGIAGVGGCALIGRFGVAGGAHGQHLPDVHAGILHEINKIICGLSQRTHAATGGKGSDVH